MNALTIAEIAIRTDAQGRYCLNDLHRASGGEKRHGPSYWLTNAQTIALVEELATTGIPVVTAEGAGGGTYVAKELVYAYAMWISATFHLEVIRAYDAMVTQQRALTPAEMFLQNAQAMVDMERRQLAQAQELTRLSRSVDTLASSMLLSTRPANSEAITHIRPRMLKKYQLPARVVDAVLRQLPYSPKPAGMVRNQREEANGASYAVYWTKDVNTTFARFVRECTRVTATKVTHPDIEDRFTLAYGLEEARP